VPSSQFVEHEGHAHRHHQPRQVGAAHDHRAGQQAEQRASRHRHHQAGERIGHHMLGEQAGAVGTETEERRMPERDDAGVAEDQVEREREQRQDRDFVDQRGMRDQHHGQRPQHDPGDDLQRVPARALQQRVLQVHRAPWRTNKPCGRHSRIAIISE
jgi:hypothetical protein